MTGKVDPKYGVDTTAAASLLLANDVVVQIDCSFDATFRNEYQVVGSDGVITVHDAYRPDNKDHQGKITVANSDGEETYVEEGDQYRLQVENFMEAVRDGGSLESYHQSTLKYLDVMEKLQQGLKG